MAYPLIGQYAASQVTHDLMHLDQDAPAFLPVERHGFDPRINLAPLLGPVSTDFFRATDKIAFERARPLHIGSHEGEDRVDVPRVESRVGCAEQLGFRYLIWHEMGGEKKMRGLKSGTTARSSSLQRLEVRHVEVGRTLKYLTPD